MQSISFTFSVCFDICVTPTPITQVIRDLYEFKPRSIVFPSYFQSTKWSSQLSRHLCPCMYTWGDRREWRIVRQSSIHFSQEKLWGPIQEPPRGPSIGLSVGQDSTPAHNFAFWVKLLGPCFPNGALTVVLLTSDVGKRGWHPLPKCESPRVLHCSSPLCSWCCHSVAQQGPVWPLHLPDTSFLKEERTTILPSC